MKKIKNRFHKAILTFLILYYSLSTIGHRLAYATDKQWSGGGDGVSWDGDANWSPSGTPAASDNASIDVQSSAVVISKNFNAKSLTVGGRTTSGLTASNFVYGTISPANNTDNALYIRKDGSITLQGAGTITLKGKFKNSEETLSDEPSFMFGAE